MSDLEPPHFNVSVDAGVVVVSGDIDMASGPLLEAAITEAEGDDALVIDLGEVDFVDSSGLRTLLAASQRSRVIDRSVVLRNVGPDVIRLLEITGTTELFELQTG